MKHFRILVLTLYLAKWTAHWWTVTGCPEPERPADPYTGERPATYSMNTVACSQEHIRTMEKLFATRDEAATFLSNCPDTNFLTGPMNAVCTDKSIEEKRH